MVAYSFKKRFIEPIQSGAKRQTIRAHRKRHARLGEPVQLYFGMRTKHCRKVIQDPVCSDVIDIIIEVETNEFDGIWTVEGEDAYELCEREMRDLARADGFASLEEMHAFWLKEHGTGGFEGVIIKWKEACP